MSPQLSVQQWLQLPQHIRLKLVKIFNLKRSEGAFVMDGHVQSDGHTYQDLAAISVEALQTFMGQHEETNFFTLFNQVVELLSTEVDDEVHKLEQLGVRAKLYDWQKLIEKIREEAYSLAMLDKFNNLIVELFVGHNDQPHEQIEKEGNLQEVKRRPGRPKKTA